ncbi:lipopolysaccharide biosynthesis protein [Tenacibaculum sp. IMCC1]|uniref:Oligosaccharide flippase family protein n=1 Tax=Tenacibaculum sp. Pbs-1 TaxID=3238748 RepID=A0AB33KY47_9FLAO
MIDIKSKKLLKTTFIYAIGSFGSKLLNFVLLPFYSYYLTKEEYGYYDIVLTTISLLVPLVTLQLSDSIFRWLVTSEKKNKEQSFVLSNALMVILFNIMIVSLVFLIIREVVTIQYFFLIYSLLVMSSIYPVIQQVARGLSKNKLYASSGIIFSLALLLTNIIFLFALKLSIKGLLIASVLSYFISTLYLIMRLKLYNVFNVKYISFSLIKELLGYSSPLILNTMSWWLIVSANKYLVLYFLGKETLGIYSFANKFPGLLLMVNSIFILAWQESLIVNFNKADRSQFFSKVFNYLISVQFSVTAFLILISEMMIKYLVSNSFYSSWKYMPILYLGVAFSTLSSFYGAIYLGSKDTKGSLKTSLFGGIINISVGLILIKPFGLYGVAISNLISFIALFLFRGINTKKYVQLFIVKERLISLLIIIIISLSVAYLNNIFISILTILVLTVYTSINNRELLARIINKIKKRIYGVS